MNNRFKYFLLTVVSLLSFAACGDDNDMTPDVSDEVLNITASILAPRPQGRAAVDAQGKGSFSPDDRITLFAAADAAPSWKSYTLTLGEGGWTPRILWREIGGERASFSAFYPTVESDGFTHSPATDQRRQADYEQSDLLHATTHTARGEEVQLLFGHLMSRLCITLNSDGSFSDEELAAAEIRIRARNAIGVRAAEPCLGELQGDVQQIIPHNEGTKFYAIVCPQPVDEQWRTQTWIELKVGEHLVSYKAPAQLADGTAFDELKSGMQINLNIELKKKPEESWSNRTAWVYGINNPDVDTWKYTDVYPSMVKGLKWAPEYGWFDCNKMDPENHQNLDSQMCWAAASANSLYWWLAQNKAYIDRYGKYTGPNQYKSLDADIFRLYRTTFGNVGADVAAALDWFITGKFGMHYKEGAGFFREVFGEVHVSRITRFSERSLSEELKYAFTHKEVIECTLDYPGTLTHAVSLWGADFDEKGEVCAIYITDNNDRALDEQSEFVDYKGREITPAGIIRKQVQKRGDVFYMEGSMAGQFTFPIIELNLLGLLEKEWQAYFAKQ